MKNPILLIAILTLFILLGCEKEKTDNLIKNKDSKVVSKLDLSDADYLVLKSTDNLKSTNSNQELYKIKIDGDNITEEKVSLLDALGNEIDSIFTDFSVNKILELKEGLICLNGSFELYLDSSRVEPQALSSILVRTSDGAIFDFNGHFPSDKSYYLNQNKIQLDKFGNVFYDAGNENIEFPSVVYKLSESQGGFSQEQYLPSGEEYFSFFIDLEGNCYYYTFPYTKVKKSEGGIATSDMYKEFYCIWNTYDNKVMASVYDSVGYLSIEDHKIKFSTFESISVGEAWTHIYTSAENMFTQVITPDINSDQKQIGNIIFEDSKKVFKLLLQDELFATNQLVIKKISGNYIFLSSEYSLSLSLFKIDLESFEQIDSEAYLLNSFVNIDFPSDLEIKTYEYNDSGEITFTALRLSDEMFVTGIVDSENTIKILMESSDKEYNNLIQLN
jgi:hypothetical protein